jgi:hypothetical protein
LSILSSENGTTLSKLDLSRIVGQLETCKSCHTTFPEKLRISRPGEGGGRPARKTEGRGQGEDCDDETGRARKSARVVQQTERRQYKQRVATADESEQLISEGWQYVETLPNGKVILKQGPVIM